MKEYIAVLTEAEWINGSGWSYSTITDTEECDSPKLDSIDWVDVLRLNEVDEAELEKIADADERDVRWTFTTYKSADYAENGEEAEELASVEKWQSEAAAEWLEVIRK